jgi:hypothetical protein
MRNAIPFTVLAATLACSLFAMPAQAQRDRVFVASYGSDSNPCTFGSPCKTFQNAVSVVAAGGEVTAIDSAGFGPVSITKSVTITSPAGIEAGIQAASGGTAISIDAPGDTIKLRGLTLEGAGAASTGIDFSAGSRLEVIDCSIGNFTEDGIFVGTSAATSLLISNTIVTDTTNSEGVTYGLDLQTSGSGSITASLDQVTSSNNYYGVLTSAGGQSIVALITNSHIDNNNIGLAAFGTSPSPSDVIMKNVTLNEDTQAVDLYSYSNLWLSQVTQTFTGVAIDFVETPSAAFSDGTNHIMGTDVGGSPGSWTSN